MELKDVVIIGGGSAGMAAAISCFDNGVKDILILEKNFLEKKIWLMKLILHYEIKYYLIFLFLLYHHL